MSASGTFVALVTDICMVLHIAWHATIDVDKPQRIPDPILDLENMGAVPTGKISGDLEENRGHGPLHYRGGDGLPTRGNKRYLSLFIAKEIPGDCDKITIKEEA